MKYRIVISTVFVAVVLALLARSEYISAQDCTMPSDAITIEEVTVWRNQYSHADHQERWDKVLAALGVDNGKAKMTVADAQTHHGTYPNARWERTVRTLQAIYCVPPTSTSTHTPTLTPTPVPPTSTPTPQPAAQDCTMPSDAVTVQEVKGWRDGHSGAEHKLRWNRVLKALGEDVDVAPMTVADSEANESKFMASRWGRVTRTLKFLACSVPPTATPVVVVPPTATPITVLPAQADQQDSQQDQPKAQSDKQQQQVACSITWEGGGSTITRREGYSVYNNLIVRGTTQTCETNGSPGHSVCARVLIDGSDQGSLNPPNYVYMDDLSIRFSPRENQKKVHHIAGARWGGVCYPVNWTRAASASGDKIRVSGSYIAEDEVVNNVRVQFQIWATNNGGQRANPVAYLQIEDNDTPCTGWDHSDVSIEEGDIFGGVLGTGVAGCQGIPSGLGLVMTASSNATPKCMDGHHGFTFNATTGRIGGSSCDDDIIRERQVFIDDNNNNRKTITIRDDDSVHYLQPGVVRVEGTHGDYQNLPSDVGRYNPTTTYQKGDKIVQGIYTYVARYNNTIGKPIGSGKCGSTGLARCWDTTYVEYDLKGVDLYLWRQYSYPYRILVYLSGAASPSGHAYQEGEELVINIPADKAAHSVIRQNITCHRDGVGHVKVRVFRAPGPEFDTTVRNQITQVCYP